MEKDYNNFGFIPPYFDPNIDINEMYKESMFNPVVQIENAYNYYKYLCMQMEYKIKCKEYEKLCSTTNSERRDRKIE